MKNEEILTALRRLKVETGSLACMGCGHERDCGIHGCRIAREAADLIEKLTDRCARYAEEIAVLQEREKWVPVAERLPEVWRNDETAELINYMIYSPDFGVDIGNYHAKSGEMALHGVALHRYALEAAAGWAGGGVMERLTQRLRTGEVLMASEYEEKYTEQEWISVLQDRLADYEDAGLEPEECENAKVIIRSAFSNDTSKAERIRKLLKADEDGRLVVLPCKVGDTVWANLDGMRHPRKCVIEFANIGSHVTTIVFSTVDGLREQYGVNPSSFGKTVFLTREEAEKALEAMEGK